MQYDAILKAVLLIYMAFNCYTDFKWLITKNVWHLAFIIIVGMYSIMNRNIPDMLIMIIVGFAFAFIFSRRPGAALGAGDFKMISAISGFIGALYGIEIIKFAIFIMVYLVSDVLIGLILLFISKVTKNPMNFASYKVEKGIIEMPQAIPLFIACILII